MSIKIAIVEDHHLIRKGITLILESFNGFETLFEAENGLAYLDKLENATVYPDIVLMDVNMPGLNGIQATRISNEKYPEIKIIALSVNTDINSIRAMIQAGANAYLFKDSAPEVFSEVIQKVHALGFYYDKHVIESLIPDIRTNSRNAGFGLSNEAEKEILRSLSSKEITFLNHCCTEATYKEIADTMDVSFRTVDGYRGYLFDKIGVKSRIGLVIFAVKTGVFKI